MLRGCDGSFFVSHQPLWLTCCKIEPMAQFPRAAALLFAVPLLVSCSGSHKQGDEGALHLTAHIEERLPFDETSFTQGLELGPDGTLYVGTGMEGASRIYRSTVDGRELASQDLAPEFFGEGITLIDGSLWQLTWQNNTAIKRDAETLEEISRATYEGEGWGLCARPDAGEVIFSDGTSELRRMDPDTLAERERFTVTLNGSPLSGLNELECVGEDIYANIFTSTDIVRIDATTGVVEAVIDASGVPNNATPDPNHVLNGIAHIEGDEFYITGKRWPDMYRVTFIPDSSHG